MTRTRMDPGLPRMTRRWFLAGLGAGTLLTVLPGSASPTAPSARLLVVMLRGGVDALHLLPPVAEPAYASARGALAVPDALALDGMFGLHPRLPFAHALYQQQQLLPVVAVAPPFRQRSHFEAQDCLENGTSSPDGARDGWLGRCMHAISGKGIAVAPVMPLSLRGATDVATWSPPLDEALQETLLASLQDLYAADVQLAPVVSAAQRESLPGMASAGRGFGLPQAMAAAAKLMTQGAGGHAGFVEDSGWDTHRGQQFALQRTFEQLDAGLRAAREGFGETWNDTVVVVVTEFGRTVRVNGTGGTDHGTGGVALLAGGAVRGGRIVGDWPGLASSQLNEGRDLRTTTDLRAVLKGVLAGHMGVDEGVLDRQVFPESRAVRPLAGLVA